MKNPGWVDLQVNGHRGIDFSAPDLTVDQVRRCAGELQQAGTAVFLPTLITNSFELYRRNVGMIRDAVARDGLEQVIPGVHIEGPFISPNGIGSHSPEWLRTPTPESIAELYAATGGFIRLLTMSAEFDRTAESIRAARELGIVVSLGHHLAGYAAIRRAADAGALGLTHLGNACPNSLDRHENPLLAGLAEDRLTALVVTDGHHLPPELIRIIYRVKGPDKIIVTSDASAAAGMPPGSCRILGNDAILYPDGRLYNPVKQCLVASASTLAQCMEYLDSLGLMTEAELLRAGRINALNLLKGRS